MDILYTNVKEAYGYNSLPPLGRSNHDLVLLSPSYKPVVPQQSVTVRTVRKWFPEAIEALRGALRGAQETTDRNILF